MIDPLPIASDLSLISLEDACLRFLKAAGNWPKVLAVEPALYDVASQLADRFNLQVAIVPMDQEWWAISDSRNCFWSPGA